jgi:probable phosphoglycerate mutase
VSETVVIIAHGGTLSALLRHAVGVPLEVPRRFRVANTALNRFTRKNERWYLEVWGDTGHLEGIGSSVTVEGSI